MPKIVDKEERRKEICLVAIELFSEKGYEKVTIKEIAEASGMGKGTIYEYFESKNDILVKSTIIFFAGIMEKMDLENIDFFNPLEGIETFAKKSVQLLKENSSKVFLSYIELLLVNLRNGSFEEIIMVFKDILFKFRNLLQNLVEEGKAKDIIPSNIDSKKISIALFAYLDGLMFHSWIYDALGENNNFKEINEVFMEIFIKGLKK